MGQAKIRHIAICTKDTRQLADFYINTFGMTQVMEQTPNDGGTPTNQRAIYVSDGYINLAILPARENPEGINHFGFQVDDPEQVARAGKDSGAQTGIAPPQFVFFTNVATEFHFSYERYLVNSLRETFGFEGTPIRITVRKRSGRERAGKH